MLAFVAIMLITLVIVWKGFMSPSAAPQSVVDISEPVRPPDVEIDFALLDKLSTETSTQGLEEFPKIPGLPEGTIVGRANPFVPYTDQQILPTGSSTVSGSSTAPQ